VLLSSDDSPPAEQLNAFPVEAHSASLGPPPSGETLYLMFQIFIDREPKLWQGPEFFAGRDTSKIRYEIASKREIETTVRDIVDRIGTKASADRRLGFIIGPVAIDLSDDQIQRLVEDAFEIALEQDVAVALHLDDSMFWFRRRELWNKVDNIEWLDWNRTPNTGRRLDWGDPPRKLAPQMCYNSKEIESEIGRIAERVIGAATMKGIGRLRAAGKEDLFGGVIAGWETQLAKDFVTNRALGYCALTNKGLSAATPVGDLDRAREQIVRDFIELWTSRLNKAGIDKSKIYSHVAFQSRTEHAEMIRNDPSRQFSYSEANNFAPPGVAFGQSHHPGFSTYPTPGLYPELYDVLLKNSTSRWASSEGTNVRMGMRSGEDTMETYLGRHFNHGATLVNVFAWGVGQKDDAFRRATENDEAIAAYRKFLRGEKLKESPIPSDYGLPAKAKRIQEELPRWVKSGGDQRKAQAMLERLWNHLKDKEPWKAEEVADEILSLIGSAQK
jgi:hypothetical protein